MEKKRLFIYCIAFIQWLIYVGIILPFTGSIAIATGGKVDSAAKVVSPFHVWILSFSIILAVLFWRVKNRKERFVTILSALTAFFSSVDFGLHFVGDLEALMAFTRIATDGLYFALAVTCTFKLLLQAIYSFANYYQKRSQRKAAT